jgi:GNAT superfamily N-acetyltransferase
LAADTPASVEFFARLKRALVSGYFVEEDPKTGRVESVAVPGYVFWPDDRKSGASPAGFGLFRALEGGYELWLAGLELGRRGEGQGRALLNALFATAQGKKTWVVRIPRGSRYGSLVQHLLKAYEFDHAGETAHLRWFVRRSAPASIAARVRIAVDARAPLN